jgi:predicted transcriptional regulator
MENEIRDTGQRELFYRRCSDIDAAVALRRACVLQFGERREHLEAECWNAFATYLCPAIGACLAHADVARYLRVSKWSERAAAVIVIGTTARAKTRGIEQCARQAVSDSDPRVRGIAQWLLAEMAGTVVTENELAEELVKCGRWATDLAERHLLELQPKTWLLAAKAMVLCAGVAEWCRVTEDGYVKSNAGDDYEAIAAGWQSAIPFLTHPMPARRLAALCVIRRHGETASGALNHVKEMMFSDDDISCRSAAIIAYGNMRKGSNDRAALAALASIVLDETQLLRHRLFAYDALFNVVGVLFHPRHRVDIARRNSSGDHTLAIDYHEWLMDVDWQFVMRCAAS